MAKGYLQKLDIPYEEKNIGYDEKAKKFVLGEGHKTVPQIYCNDKLLVEGGADALISLSKEEIQSRMEELNG
jgi:glutaredoxin